MKPTVSILVPCYNEKATIRFLLNAIYAQTYPRDKLEVIIADGLSMDGTRDEIAKFQNEHADLNINIVDNPVRSIPSGLNSAIDLANGDILLRLDAHSGPHPQYIENCVSALEEGKGDNVGGVWEIRPGNASWIARSIAKAAGHPVGVGDALYRHATRPAHVDTVPFGSFYRDLINRVGKFDETLLTNEDYEFNARIIKNGGRIWLDPAIRSVYFARGTIGALAKQYARYGYWKWRMLNRYPNTLRLRQALPPLFVILLMLGVIFIGVTSVRYLFFGVLGTYFAILLAAGIITAIQERKIFFIVGLPLAITTMHVSWGTGFLWSMIAGIIRSK